MTTNKEWLYSLEPDELAAWFDAEHVDANDVSTRKNDVRADGVCANDANVAQDSREKLEADVRKRYTHTVSTAMWPPSANKHTDMVSVSIDTVLEWLDRQAAITANETSHDNPYVGLVRGKQWERTERSDYYCGSCGWKVTDHDSYCPECGGALHGAPNKPDGKFDARKTAETPETDTAKGDIRDFDDTREKLEDDIQSDLAALSEYGKLMLDWYVVMDWLDRQDAITEREAFMRGRASLDNEFAEYTDEIAELKAMNERLQVALDAVEGCDERCLKLESERDALADDLLACNRERESLRKTLGVAIDHAHDILQLIDEGMA